MDAKFLRANELGIRLEIVGGLPIWEPQPVYKHQKAIDRIRATIEKMPTLSDGRKNDCDFVHTSDVYINFPDGSLKRPIYTFGFACSQRWCDAQCLTC
jgi:hypothetical protein